MPYQNTRFDAGRSEFVTVNPTGTTDVAIFTGKSSSLSTAAGKIQMIALGLTLNSQQVIATAEAPDVIVNRSVKVSIGAVKGDSVNISASITEAIRLLEIARTSYNGDVGLVPTGLATFAVV